MTVTMNPRTHPRGAAPIFTLPAANPSSYQTDALFWLMRMRLLLEPGSQNGGTYANKPGSHNIGRQLVDHGEGNARTDHSIRHRLNRTGAWWRDKCSAHDWTFPDAQRGDHKTIRKYTDRLIDAMEDPADPRPELAYHYTIGQRDGDRVIEAYQEISEEAFTSDDRSHDWHRHDSFLRCAVGDYWRMWAALTIDMGWTVAEWRRSLPESTPAPAKPARPVVRALPIFPLGARLLEVKATPMRGTDVRFVQRYIGEEWCGPADGAFGGRTRAGVIRYQDMRGIDQDGRVGPVTWRNMGVK